MKNYTKLTALALSAVLFAGCANLIPGRTATPTFETVPETTAAAEETESESSKRMQAYQLVVQQVSFEHVWPDGQEFTLNDGSFIENEKFCIMDVDGDGKDELMISVSQTCMAEMRMSIYSYSEELDMVLDELSEFPVFKLYDHGYLQADWSHSQGLAGNAMWPYNLYRCDESGNEYMQIASVDAISRDFAEEAGVPEQFPADADKDNAGVVYLVTRSGQTETMSMSDYYAWRDGELRDVREIVIPWQDMTEENIRNMA